VTWSTDWTRARLHLEFLQRHGYVLSDAERQELGQNAAEENSEPRRGSSTGGPLPADWLPGPGG